MNSKRFDAKSGPRERALAEPVPVVRPWMLAVATLLLVVVGFATARAQDGHAGADVDQAWRGYAEQPLRVNVWHDRQDEEVYQRGEAVRVHFEVNADAYVVVYRIDAEGEVSILWPRSRYDDGFVFGSHTYNLPAPGAERIRAANEEGIEYIQAIVSAYPFDLRGIEVDFHHERDAEPQRYFVAGDPFLAMNDVNYAITGLEDPEEYVATNYVSYYVHRKVDHPRYLCSQCHDGQDREPYRDRCVIEIHHDYGWDNQWYGDFGYYPVYYYPVYYYVDPWTWRPWINYWYRPWYSWPSWDRHHWDYDCYVWNNSPQSRGDVWTRYKEGSRRYRPISKDERYKSAPSGDTPYPSGLVKSPRPTSKDLAALQTKTSLGPRPATKVRDGGMSGAPFRDISRTTHKPAEFSKPARSATSPGIRVPEGPRAGGGVVRPAAPEGRAPTSPGGSRTGGREDVRVLKGTRGEVPAGDRVVRPRPDDGRSSGSADSKVRPVEPRNRGSRIWSGGGSSGKGSTPQVKPRGSGDAPASKPTPQVKPSLGSTSGSTPPPRVQPSGSSGSSGKSPTPQVKPRSSGSSSSKSGGTSKGGGTSKSTSGGGSSSGSTRSKGSGR